MEQKLRTFITIVECGSFSEAAARLYTSQSALSQQIRSLEKQLGFELFNHQSRRMKLTQAGENFYPHARQICADYANAVLEGRSWAQAEKERKRRLRIGCLGEQYFHVWQNLLPAISEIEERYAPVAMRFDSREALYQAFQMDKVDITFQMEDPAIEHFGLCFAQLTTYPLLAVPVYIKEVLPAPVTLEDLSHFRIAFHYPPGNTIYEDSLLSELRACFPDTVILEPRDFFNADYGISTLILVPALEYTGKPENAIPLSWQGEISAGFIHRADAGSSILDFEKSVMEHFV